MGNFSMSYRYSKWEESCPTQTTCSWETTWIEEPTVCRRYLCCACSSWSTPHKSCWFGVTTNWGQLHKTMVSTWNAKTSLVILLFGNYSPISLTSSPSAPLPIVTSSQSTEGCRPLLSQSTKSKAWIGFRKFLTMGLCAIWCGVTLKKARLASSYRQGEQAISLAKKFSRSICTIMDSHI